MSFTGIEVGSQARFEVILEETDIEAFARLSGDRSPLHMDAGFARDQAFDNRAAHAFLIGTYVSRRIVPGSIARRGKLVAASPGRG